MDNGDRLARLTEREKVCLRQWLQHKSAKEIAADLRISHHAVEKRLKMARTKLGATSSLEAARMLNQAEGYGQTVAQTVRRALEAGRRRHIEKRTPEARAPLTGRIFDALGEPMSPTTSRGKQGRYYRYYVSASLQKGGQRGQGGQSAGHHEDNRVVQRISADALEEQLTAIVFRLLPRRASEALTLPSRIEVHGQAVHLTLDKSCCVGIQGRLSPDERIEEDLTDPTCLRLVAAIRIRNRQGRTEIRSSTIRTTRRDPILIGALQRAHAMVELDTRHLPFCRSAPDTQYGRRLIRLAFLAPDLQRAILDGTQPADLTLDHLIAAPTPCDWNAQRRLFDHV